MMELIFTQPFHNCFSLLCANNSFSNMFIRRVTIANVPNGALVPASWRYRLLSFTGVAIVVTVALSVANLRAIQELAMVVPIYNRLTPIVIPVSRVETKLPVVLLVVLLALSPLYKPQPRHVLDILSVAVKRVFVATFCLATIGYFDYTYQLPRPVLILMSVLLVGSIPAWFVLIRKQASTRNCAVIVGDSPKQIAAVYSELTVPVFGYVTFNPHQRSQNLVRADGGLQSYSQVPDESDNPIPDELKCLGGLARLEQILISYSVDTVILAFSHPDREEFFGTLETCAKLGVTTKAHRDLHNSVLTRDEPGYSELVDIDLDPWDWQDRVLKRLFDLLFAGSVLLVLSPLLLLAAIAIKVEDRGPIFYTQERTSTLGETFSILKFRSMTPGKEDTNPGEETNRVTRTGKILRKTHIDEIPQLLAILQGKMSVVGPRPAWTDEEAHLQSETPEWRKRWFVKPGLTGLAQINDITSTQATQKLQYDIEYIRHQSLWFDIRIVSKQLLMVAEDVVELFLRQIRVR